MSRSDKYGLRELKSEFPNDDACLEYIFDSLHTRECSCGGHYSRLPGRKQFQCSKCRFQIAPMAGTIFEKSTTPLTLWFHAILVFSNAKSGISAKQMERELNVTYKTAWRILHLIRSCLTQDDTTKLTGIVESDEAFFGGRKESKKRMQNKTRVMTAIQREGKTRAKVVPDLTYDTTYKFLQTNVKKASRLYTDSAHRFPKKRGYTRESVNHTRKEWARKLPNGNVVHVNNVESFNGHVKRSIRGVYKSVSQAYFQEYLDSFVWHRNNRHNDNLRFGALLSEIVRPS